MPTIWTIDHLENKHSVYRGVDFMKIFCESLRQHTKSTIDFEKKKMSPLTKKN